MVVHGLCETVLHQVFPHVIRHQYRLLAVAPRVHVELAGTAFGRSIQDSCEDCASFPQPLQVKICWVHTAGAPCYRLVWFGCSFRIISDNTV